MSANKQKTREDISFMMDSHFQWLVVKKVFQGTGKNT